ncbi:early secretory antigenic target protein ESAT-6 [Mycobacterium sp. MAA66]|jgi:early secretory antigenic target protein ESAT-6|uniref:WXG100 family type VII secretion target n=1 Tax=Mycobacterium sp. MAA66 TaxID=3156297 RepID=UPI003519408D
MTDMTYNFAGIADSASGIMQAVGTTQHLLDEGKGSLAKLGAAWHGDGQGAYEAEQMKWDSNALELNEALQQLAQAVAGAGEHMMSTEQGVTGSFHG